MQKFYGLYIISAILFVSFFLLDWYYISAILTAQPYLSHWNILFPMLVTLFVIFEILALFGMYLKKSWGFIAAYFVLIALMFFMMGFYVHSIPSFSLTDFVLIFIGNLLVLIYIVFMQTQTKK